MSVSAGQLVTTENRHGSTTMRATSGSVTLPGTDARSFRVEGATDIVCVSADGAVGDAASRLMLQSPRLAGIGVRALALLRGEREELEADLLVVEVLDALAPTPVSTTFQGGLSAAQLRRATALIEAEVDVGRSPRLVDLADAAGASLFHFAREFRRTTGASPHEYSLRRRVERARQRLLLTDEPVAAIAGRCGFASAAHLIRRFRQRVGVTPGRYRTLMGS
jgi:AraC family transcriptional regulator